MEWIAVITGIALIEYMVFGFRAGSARGKYDVPAPKISGNEIFERHFRVHQNTMEQLVVFIPSLWIFATYTSATIAAALGAVFVIARPFYGLAYVADPGKRTAGFAAGFLANVALVLGAIGGALMSAI